MDDPIVRALDFASERAILALYHLILMSEALDEVDEDVRPPPNDYPRLAAAIEREVLRMNADIDRELRERYPERFDVYDSSMSSQASSP